MSRNIKKKKRKSTTTLSGHTCASCVNEIKHKRETKNRAHTFYRLLFTHFQGLCSMELDEERKEKKKTIKIQLLDNL